VQINVSARPDEMVAMLETLAAAITAPTIDVETTNAARSFVAKQAADAEADIAVHADRAARERFFGTFPYGRPQIGTSSTLQEIDFADLRFAYDRFFRADNATLALSGNFERDTAYRAVRRFFGNWLKSDRQIPSTFRQPDAPPAALEILNAKSGSGGAEVRHIIRGIARSDADYHAVRVLTAVLDARLKQRAAVDPGAEAFVRSDANQLPGAIVFGVSGLNPDMKAKVYGGTVESIDAVKLVPSLMSLPVTSTEFQAARTLVTSAPAAAMEERWLDADTYKISAAGSDRAAYVKLTLADVQRVRERLAKQPAASVWIVRGVGASN
nr:insulinase family protein [Blastocatellia bacterium]